MRQFTRISLVQIMDCRLFDAKPLSKSMLFYCQLHPWEQTSMKFESKFNNSQTRSECENVKWLSLCFGLIVLTHCNQCNIAALLQSVFQMGCLESDLFHLGFIVVLYAILCFIKLCFNVTSLDHDQHHSRCSGQGR